MKVNILEAKNQLSKLVKAAVAGEEVIIASNGEPQVRLSPCVASPGLRHWGVLSKQFEVTDAAFSDEVDLEVSKQFGVS